MSVESRVVLLTATGDRQESFTHCERMLSRQKLSFDEWFIVDDGKRGTKVTLGQNVLRMPSLESPVESFKRNMINLLEKTKPNDIICFIEDDDWYCNKYLSFVYSCLTQGVSVVGESTARYYHLPTQSYRVIKSTKHASLCQTAFKSSRIRDLLLQILLNVTDPFIDKRLWGWAGHVGVPTHLDTGEPYVVGIKGVPGRKGLGFVHKYNNQKCPPPRFTPDKNFSTLREWVGTDVSYYKEMLNA